jgi:hypothetical protein
MFLNTLCVDESCKTQGHCQHLGPQGQHCYFNVEKRLCAALGRTWIPQLDLDSLLTEIEKRLAGDSDLTLQLAKRLKTQPSKFADLTPPDLERDPT